MITTVCRADIDGSDKALPEKTAVIPIVPAARLLVVKVAMPEEFTVPVPTSVSPLKKLTVPVGVLLGAGETVAVKVSGCPTVPGLATVLNVVVVDTG